ncbi:MAG: ArnT family glycosyltransferase, partial [Anaerolineales bacterium]
MTRDIGRYLRSKFRGENVGAFALLATFLVLALTSLPRLSQTTDEPLHYRYGRKILQSDAGRFDDSKMPVSALNALPAWLGERLPEGRISRGLRYWQVARLPTLAAAVGLGLVVLAWGRSLYGRSAGLLSLALFVFDPNILAHSRLITTDLYLAAAVGLSLYLFWRFARRRTLARAVAAALALGLAQITKYTAVALFPLFGLLILVYDLPRLSKALRRRGWQIAARYLVWSSALVAFFLATAIVIINFAFVRERTFRPLQDYAFQSQFFRGLQSRAAGAAWLRVPVPYPYLQGLDAVLYRERSNVGYGQIYLLGELRRGEGFPAYFLVAYALKTPLASQAVFLLAIAGLLRRRSWRGFVRQEQFLVVPLIAFGVYF